MLLIRVRAAREAAGTELAGAIALEAEAIVDYESIFPPMPFTIDLGQLQASVASPNNEYGVLLGTQPAPPGLSEAHLHRLASQRYFEFRSCSKAPVLTSPSDGKGLRSSRRAGDPLAIRRDTPFSRFAAVELPQEIAPEDSRFHLLVAIAGPAADDARFGVSPIDAASELRRDRRRLHRSASERPDGNSPLLPGKSGLPAEIREKLTNAHVKIADGFTTAEQIASHLDKVDGLHIIAHGRQGNASTSFWRTRSWGFLLVPMSN